MEIDRNGLEVLDRDECLRLLASATIGRIGFTSGALPTVLPVNFFVDEQRILVRTGRGGKLDAAIQNAVVAFEADHFDAMHHSGWSVSVTGVATEIVDPADLQTARQLPVARWVPSGELTVIAISLELISGRRIGAGSHATKR